MGIGPRNVTTSNIVEMRAMFVCSLVHTLAAHSSACAVGRHDVRFGTDCLWRGTHRERVMWKRGSSATKPSVTKRGQTLKLHRGCGGEARWNRTRRQPEHDVQRRPEANSASGRRMIVRVGCRGSGFSKRAAERRAEHLPRRNEERGQNRTQDEAHRAKEHESPEC